MAILEDPILILDSEVPYPTGPISMARNVDVGAPGAAVRGNCWMTTREQLGRTNDVGDLYQKLRRESVISDLCKIMFSL